MNVIMLIGLASVLASAPATPPAIASVSDSLALAPANPAIDMPAYLLVATEAAKYRESHRVTEADFIRMKGRRHDLSTAARRSSRSSTCAARSI
jgi:hypothetical protein